MYFKLKTQMGRTYWDCVRTKAKECSVCAITSEPQAGQPIQVYKRPAESAHLLAPNSDKVTAKILTQALK